jgi:iron complex outermembrane receptor protein
MDKKFGANGFYSERFPDQWEHTRTAFVALSGKANRSGMSLDARILWRRHEDEFLLDRTRPEWYRNRHRTDIYSAELQQVLSMPLGDIAFGGEIGSERIDSSNLGDHERVRSGAFLEYRAPSRKMLLNVGAFAYYYSDWGWEVWPGLDMGIELPKVGRIFASVGRSFRVPTYTGLYYKSPANQGNPLLKPEKSWSYETGLKWKTRWLVGKIGVFWRRGTDIIDWTRSGADSPWIASNIASINTVGYEIELLARLSAWRGILPIRKVEVDYSYMDSDKDTDDIESKYALEYLEHQLLWKVETQEVIGFRGYAVMRYEKRVRKKGYLLLDVSLSKRFSNMELFFKGSNLTNEEYSEVGGVPAPPRWILAGMKVMLGGG